MVISGIGEILWDNYGKSRYLGGAIANCVHHVEKMGHNGILISRVGSDSAGQDLVKSWKEKGYNKDFIQYDKNNVTGWVKVILDQNKVPSFSCNPSAAYDFLEWEDAWLELIPRLDAVIYGTFAQRTAQSAGVTERFLNECRNIPKVFDINIRTWNKNTKSVIMDGIPRADILKFNKTEYMKLRELIPAIPDDPVSGLKKLVELWDLKLVCMTVGEYGCLAVDSRNTVYSPGIKVNVVDTTGAGDAFISAMTVKYLEGATLNEMAGFANICAANVVRFKGATPEYSLADIKALSDGRKDYNIFGKWKKLMQE